MSSSDSEEETYFRYGTPLEPFEDDEIPSKRKYQQQTDQYAVDEHGRRRFHGAFTGGFSAGFGNTVGSQEGWTPATFKSSRSDKAQFSSQRPEDFMDEEDRGEFGIAPRLMETQKEFSGQKRPKQQRYHDGPIPGEPVLEQLLQPVHETAAVRMLRGMGWREGQGVGDRLRKDKKKQAVEQRKTYGCYVPEELRKQTSDQDDDESDLDIDYDVLYAPDDYEPYIASRKSDYFGLGYVPLSRHSVLGNLMAEYGSTSSTSHLSMKEKGKKVSIRGQAFGVGAFENDDQDIYAKEDMSHYDFAIGGVTEDKLKKPDAKPQYGRVLEGFVKSSKPMPSVPQYPPPALARDYTPKLVGARRTRFEPTAEPARDQGLGRHELTAEARGAMLGEVPITLKPAATTTPPDPVTKTTSQIITFVPPEPEEQLDFISIKDSGKELTKVFKPFMDDPKKQARYEAYLKDKNSLHDSYGDGDRLSEWERDRELTEFEQAAKLYKPLTGIMGDRFTHAAEPDSGALNPLCAVAKSAANCGHATQSQREAASRGVYGVMTRTETPWRPESIVCKRFNVPEPGVTRNEPSKEVKPKVSYSIFSYLESSVHDRDSFTKEQSKFSGSKSLSRETVTQIKHETAPTRVIPDLPAPVQKPVYEEVVSNKRMTVADLFLKESVKSAQQGSAVNETINQFNKMDLYKSIFLSDSEDEDAAPEKNDNESTDFLDVPKNVERNNSPPRGIFANIDFDELNSWRRNVDDKKPEEKPPEKPEVSKVDKPEQKEDEVYGPKIPESLKRTLEKTIDVDGPTFNPKLHVVDLHSSSSSDSWVDANEAKPKKSKKKKSKSKSKSKSKKHKSKHKKSKHKKKDR